MRKRGHPHFTIFRYPALVRGKPQSILRRYWPELLLVAAFLYFALRKLGTFPDAWADDGLFMIVARNLAEGNGYALPVFDELWNYPYILGIGPTIIWPAALFIWLFGFSVTVARIPMVLYLAAAAFVTYRYTKRIDSLTAARWATALLISFSAFINTGKPVLGEIPAFLFLMLGLIALDRGRGGWLCSVRAGVLFGLAVVTKLTFGLIYPALGFAWIFHLVRRDWKELRHVTLTSIVAVLTFAVFSPVLGYWDPGFIGELKQYGLADGGGDTLQVLRTQPDLLLRFQYLIFGLFFVLGSLGIYHRRRSLTRTHAIVLATVIALFVLFFLNGRGWYRHLLPAHLLLIPFLPAGVAAFTQRRFVAIVLTFFVAAQGWWQLTYRGSRLSPEAADAAVALDRQFRDRPLLITQPEIHARVLGNPRWHFLSEEFKIRTYPRFEDVPVQQEQHCLPILRKISADEAELYKGRLTPVHERYMLIEPQLPCEPQPQLQP
jgi:4-amino-4-deoxy-L-arabinose transferase-like glycosyltransferase